ncbi:hypothetical protein CSB20_04255 [bacterium DOLZORAL124_64_63]|nr:MAG: hypothetical protein CSB20_04255 [bacterium DOLZORAL124_64_63]
MKILVTDPDPDHLHMLIMFIRDLGHEALYAEDGRTAVRLWENSRARMVVAAWDLPDMTGLDLCRRIRRQAGDRYTYLMLIGRINAPDEAAEGLEGGVDDYMIRPVRMREFQARLENGLRILDLETRLNRRYDAMRINYLQIIRMFSNLMEVYDRDLGAHARNTARIALDLARRLPEVAESEYEEIESAALLHDIGMIGLPHIIRVKSRVERSEEESHLYRLHPVIGQGILEEIEILAPVARIVGQHHEQFNGRGFPEGKAGEEIPLNARIIAAASTYDNLVRRGEMPLQEIPQKLQQMKGYQLDPRLTDLLMGINQERMIAQVRSDFREIPLEDLETGMVLARDVRRQNGALLMPAGTAITTASIDKLKRQRCTFSSGKTVFIYEEAERETETIMARHAASEQQSATDTPKD